MNERRNKRKQIIVILIVLLCISICALVGVYFFRAFFGKTSDTVMVPDNLITPDTTASDPPSSSDPTEEDEPERDPSEDSTDSAAAETIAQEKNPTLTLHSRNPGDNIPFQVENLWPGDQVRNEYCIQVSYRDTVTVKFHASIRPGYEKLAEVLQCKVTLGTTETVLYDGLMRDMPDFTEYTLSASGAATDSLSFQILVSLDTSVGNEYQNQTLIADFHWWVDDTSNLDPPPNTGDTFTLLLWLCLCLSGLGLLLLLLLRIRRKEEVPHEE